MRRKEGIADVYVQNQPFSLESRLSCIGSSAWFLSCAFWVCLQIARALLGCLASAHFLLFVLLLPVGGEAGSFFFLGRGRSASWCQKEEEGNVNVLGPFVKVPSGAAAPIKCKPMGVDAIKHVAGGREQRKRVTFDCSKPTV